MCNKIWHHHTNNLGSLTPQTLSKGIGTVVSLFSQLFHPLLHFLTNLRTTMQRTAYRSYAHTEFLCKVFKRYSMFICLHIINSNTN